ncbi:MAG TPA: alpha/beta hydrolase, partial [Solirubrobacteraceae bacterium]|nr:alpha/beta hydrolase [Solirubrobacteraceae bacterium]
IGHLRDPIHPFSDAGALVEEMPNARMIQASWIGELRVTPERLTDEIAAFVDECWGKTAAVGSGSGRRRARAARA